MPRLLCLWAESCELLRAEGLTGCAAAQKYSDESVEIPRPDNWGGYLVRPSSIEFWQGRPSRLHDRLLYTRQGQGKWLMQRLAP